MNTFIQLHDGIGYAVIKTSGEVDHSVTPEHITAVAYDGENPEQFIGKRYDEKSQTWSEASLITFAEIDDNGKAIEIRKTYFNHEITGPILPDGWSPMWTYKNGDWEEPFIEAEETIVDPLYDAEPIRLARVAKAELQFAIESGDVNKVIEKAKIAAEAEIARAEFVKANS